MNAIPYATYPPAMLSPVNEVEDLHTSERQKSITLGETIVSKFGSLSRIGNIEVKVATMDDIMDSHGICDYLKITPKQLYNLRRNYGLPGYKPSGKALFFRRSEVDNWLDTCGLTT